MKTNEKIIHSVIIQRSDLLVIDEEDERFIGAVSLLARQKNERGTK